MVLFTSPFPDKLIYSHRGMAVAGSRWGPFAAMGEASHDIIKHFGTTLTDEPYAFTKHAATKMVVNYLQRCVGYAFKWDNKPLAMTVFPDLDTKASPKELHAPATVFLEGAKEMLMDAIYNANPYLQISSSVNLLPRRPTREMPRLFETPQLTRAGFVGLHTHQESCESHQRLQRLPQPALHSLSGRLHPLQLQSGPIYRSCRPIHLNPAVPSMAAEQSKHVCGWRVLAKPGYRNVHAHGEARCVRGLAGEYHPGVQRKTSEELRQT
jgi:hypothetical protein